MHTFWQQCLELLLPHSKEVRVFKDENEKSILEYYQPRWSGKHIALSLYQDPVIQALVAANKFQTNQQAHTLLACLLKQYLNSYPDTKLVLLPMPLVLRRKHKRGYNQVQAILEKLPKYYRKNIYKGYLRKTSFTQPQTDLKREERLTNVKDTFYCKPIPIKQVNTSVLIIDDVLTTGSTLEEAKKAVKKAVPKGTKIQTIAIAH